MPKDLESLIKDVAHADRLPEAALRALVPHAAALTVRLKAVARRRMEGEWLYPEEENLLFYGLFVLAAARAHDFWPTWIELLTCSDDGLDGLFGDGAAMSIRDITLGLVAEDVVAVAELAAGLEVSAEARAGLVAALARLTCEGRYSRRRFVALIDALAALEGTDDDDRCKWCVEEAIVLGGVSERRALLEQLWTTSAFSIWRDVDKQEALERLGEAAADPTDMARFDEVGVAAPVDPSDGLRWLKAIERHADPADFVDALSWREREWLASFLRNDAGPEDAMNFERLDGLFHALVLGPEIVMPSEYLREIWGEGPVFEDGNQAHKVMTLLQRHWNAIAQRNVANLTPKMWMEAHDDAPPGRHWAMGFSVGVAMRTQAWQGVSSDEGAYMALQSILDLVADSIEPWDRTELLDMLAEQVAYLANFWLEQRTPRQPIRSQKVGRNEPCPCGSGKKWKKCCGAGPPPILH
ncbi:MAG: UPF0149 family protein [Hyphomonadaceae bacterium JAD_PAG50586_4]|nr:MAG: UPF0149 family protein [Hyphomonadaceae bacterium JAD_PAG50586_4]